jgi:hypothetical protein
MKKEKGEILVACLKMAGIDAIYDVHPSRCTHKRHNPIMAIYAYGHGWLFTARDVTKAINRKK